ncbi:MAG: PEP-CTERM sorting domain-containing protein [Candidatus Korobacteraceae bacterium]
MDTSHPTLEVATGRSLVVGGCPTTESESFTLNSSSVTTTTTSSTPEPSTMMLLGSVILGLVTVVRRRLIDD